MTLVFKKHNGPTPPQIITDCGNLTLDFMQLGLWASPPFLQTLGPWFPNEIQNLLSSEKRTLDHWATVQFFFSLGPGKTPLTLSVVQEWLNKRNTTTVTKFLDTLCVVALDALTPASVHSLWSSPKFLNRFCLTILIRLWFSSVWIVPSFLLPHFFLPLNFLLTCLDTALCEQPASLAMNVCGLPSLWRVSWVSSGQLSDQQSSPWLCSLVNQTERPFWRLRKPLQVFWVD